jgi:hypothetical protein
MMRDAQLLSVRQLPPCSTQQPAGKAQRRQLRVLQGFTCSFAAMDAI